MNRFVYLFDHLPKTAGMTLRNHFLQHLTLHDRFIHLGRFGFEDERKRGLPPFSERSPEQRNRAYVILGHFVDGETQDLVSGKEPRHIIFLRDPADRLVSLYNFKVCTEKPGGPGRLATFDGWYEGVVRNSICHWLCSKYLKCDIQAMDQAKVLQLSMEVLRNRFWFVGTTQTFAEDSCLLMKTIGLPPITKKYNVTGIDLPRVFSIDDSLRNRIYSENPCDRSLYEHVQELKLSRFE